MSGALLKVEDIHVYYGSIHAIKGVSFEVNEGEIVTLIGANGAGKSTCLNAVSGLLRPREGNITFLGRSLTKTPPHRVVEMGLAQVPEGRRIFLHMTVRENLEMGAYTQHARGAAAMEDDIAMVYDLFPRLGERARQIAGTLSGGEQQMLAIGRALMENPRILMLDEPSLGLSPLLVSTVFELIQTIAKAGTTVLLVEQNVKQALKISSWAYVLENGVVAMNGPSSELIDNPYVKKAFLGL